MQPNRKYKTRQNPYYFDTLSSTQELEDSGFTHEQAVAQTKVISRALSKVSENYTTKQDLDLLEERLKRMMDEKIHRIEEKINDLHLKMLENNNYLLKVMAILIGSSTTITIGVLGFLIK